MISQVILSVFENSFIAGSLSFLIYISGIRNSLALKMTWNKCSILKLAFTIFGYNFLFGLNELSFSFTWKFSINCLTLIDHVFEMGYSFLSFSFSKQAFEYLMLLTIDHLEDKSFSMRGRFTVLVLLGLSKVCVSILILDGLVLGTHQWNRILYCFFYGD